MRPRQERVQRKSWLTASIVAAMSMSMLLANASAEPGNDIVPGGGGRAQSHSAGGASKPDQRSPHRGPSAVFGVPPFGTIASTSPFDTGVDACWGPLCTGGDPCFASSSITVSGLADEIWDVDLLISIVHEHNDGITITLTSPAGSTVLLADRRGQGAADGYNGAEIDDSETELVTDIIGNGTPFPPFVPEGALGQFFGENPNGTWTLSVTDHFCNSFQDSLIDGWSIYVTTLDTALTESTAQFTNATLVPIPNPGIITPTLTISGAGESICEVNLTTVITHTWTGDLSIYLTSPAGTSVKLSSGNGGDRDNLFNGTVWTDQAIPYAVTTYPFVNGQVATPLVGEGNLSAFMGEDPNGTWTLTIDDTTNNHMAANSGSLESWSLEVKTCSTPGSAYCFGDNVDLAVTANCPCANFGNQTHGCANSAFASGARLIATGEKSPNTILFVMKNVPNNTLATGFRNTTNTNQAGVVFGDGVRCQSGVLIRFGAHNTGTLGDPPNTWTSPTDTISPGLSRYYQVQYRNSAAAFCPPATFNISNGYRIDW